jgi:hypothetical protein
MGTPLTTLTQKPIQYNTFSFGSDDTSIGKSGFFGTIAQWDLNAKDDCFKANFVFLVKKAFAFLDAIGIGMCFFGRYGFIGEIEDCEHYQTGPLRNQQAREKVVAALGGESVCRSIPVVNFNAQDLTDYLKLGDEYFRGGQWVVQTEDPAGRKAVVMRLVDRLGTVHTATAHQRYRETCFRNTGDVWTLNFVAENLRGFGVDPNTDRVAEFIEKVRTLRHEQFAPAPKP